MRDGLGQGNGGADARSGREARLARDLDALRRGLEAETPLPPDEVRRRVDAIADELLSIHEDGSAD